jgi:hypothetical protein
MYLKKPKEWRKLKDKKGRYQVPLEGAKVFIRALQQVNEVEDKAFGFEGSAFVPEDPEAGTMFL